MKRWMKTIAVGAIAFGLCVAGGTAAGAATHPDGSSDVGGSELTLVVHREEGWVPVDAEAMREALFNLHATSSETGSTPFLLNWDQWFGCFSLNNEVDVFARYWFPWDGRLNSVNLKCGNSGYGYKHIQEKHDKQWEGVLNAARSRGWNSAAYGVNSWDDLMSGVTSGVISDPGPGLTKNSASNKWCTKAEFGLWDTSRTYLVYQFGVETVWASDSDRLITSFPSDRKVC